MIRFSPIDYAALCWFALCWTVCTFYADYSRVSLLRVGGLCTYFFALAGLAWFIHPWLFIVATTWVTVVLYRREFRSRSHTI